MNSSNDIIERKVIDTNGRLGSHYDVIRDRLVSDVTISGIENPTFQPTSECCVLSSTDSNDVIHLLQAIKFDDALLHSLLFGIIQPSGISSLVTYDQPINEHIRFLY